MNQGKVIITEDVTPLMEQELISLGFEPINLPGITYESLSVIIHEFTGIIISTRTKIDQNLIDQATRMKFVGRVGSGMEHVDVTYCKSKGIACLSSPEGNANAVGEHALGMLLSLTRNIQQSNRELKQHIWHRKENMGFELAGKTLGIIGFGHTGPAFAKKLSGFEVEILVYDKYKNGFGNDQIKEATLNEIQEKADIISFHVPYNAETHHYLDSKFIASCKKKPVFINTSRGAVADTKALLEALKNDSIRGLCIDVYEDEPLGKGEVNNIDIYDKLLAFDNVIATSHIAGWTWEAKEKMVKVLVEKIKNIL